MKSTRLWVPLAVAALGLLSTLVGVLLTQRRSDRRENTSWKRERERERERWAREDAARTFEHRREAYADFYESLRQTALAAYNHGMGLGDHADDGQLGEGWQTATYRKLQHLRLYGSSVVDAAASEAYSAAWWWGFKTDWGKADHGFYEHQERYDVGAEELLLALRRDLGVPEDAITGADICRSTTAAARWRTSSASSRRNLGTLMTQRRRGHGRRLPSGLPPGRPCLRLCATVSSTCQFRCAGNRYCPHLGEDGRRCRQGPCHRPDSRGRAVLIYRSPVPGRAKDACAQYPGLSDGSPLNELEVSRDRQELEASRCVCLSGRSMAGIAPSLDDRNVHA